MRKEKTQIDYEVPYAYSKPFCWLEYSRRYLERNVDTIDSDQAISMSPDFDSTKLILAAAMPL
jgi:hypothetical protein